ncbi:hypothetical protein BKA93DRAFT_195112 [Sparassis latifolia]
MMVDVVPTIRSVYDSDPDWLTDASSSYLRIAAISIAVYDYLLTLPAEWRFYKVQRSWMPSLGCILFILIRMITVTVSAIGFFASFSPQSCQRWFMVTPVFKVLQMVLSQIIMGIRTVNISRRKPWVVWTMLVVFLVVTCLEFFTNLYDRNYVQDRHNNCTGGDNSAHLSVWLFYVVAMFYDVVTIGISTYFLVSFSPSSGRLSRLVRLMLYDGIGYLVLLTAANVLNLVLYRTSDGTTQSSGACLSFAVVWIMSQRILIHLRGEYTPSRHPFTGIGASPLRRPRRRSIRAHAHDDTGHLAPAPVSARYLKRDALAIRDQGSARRGVRPAAPTRSIERAAGLCARGLRARRAGARGGDRDCRVRRGHV